MRVVPETQNEKIQFFVTRLARFAEHAVAIGTTPEAVADLAAKTETARAKYMAAREARQKARSATQELTNALAAMEVAGQGIIKQVRVKASLTGNGVYSLASISPPAKPSPIGTPGTPSALTVKLLPQGNLDLKWKCRHPAGTVGVIYQVYRRSNGEGEFRYLGAAGERRYVDDSVPVGAGSITYRIRATRSTGAGESADFPVSLGVSEGAAKQLERLAMPGRKGKLAA